MYICLFIDCILRGVSAYCILCNKLLKLLYLRLFVLYDKLVKPITTLIIINRMYILVRVHKYEYIPSSF